MSALINIFSGILGILEQLVWVYSWVVIITALLSWVRPDPNNPVVQFLYRVTTPAYELVRRIMRTTYNGIDFAPLIIIITLQIIMLILAQIRYAL